MRFFNELIVVDKKYPECCAIDTVPWLNRVAGPAHEKFRAYLEALNERHNKELQDGVATDFYDYFTKRSPYTDAWIADPIMQTAIGNYLRKKTGVEYVPAHDIGNVYNNENDFSDVFQYQVWVPMEDARWHEKAKQWYCDEWYYRDDCFVITELHMGGDVRGNYGVPELRGPVSSLCEAGFIDWMLGWYVTFANGDNADEDGRFSSGYSQNPTCELLNSLKGEKMVWSEQRDCFVGWLNGRAVQMCPDYYAAGA